MRDLSLIINFSPLASLKVGINAQNVLIFSYKPFAPQVSNSGPNLPPESLNLNEEKNGKRSNLDHWKQMKKKVTGILLQKISKKYRKTKNIQNILGKTQTFKNF